MFIYIDIYKLINLQMFFIEILFGKYLIIKHNIKYNL